MIRWLISRYWRWRTRRFERFMPPWIIHVEHVSREELERRYPNASQRAARKFDASP